MTDVYSLAMEDTRLGKESVRSLAGPCPNSNCRCQTNGFYIKWSSGEWRFACRGCWDPQEIKPNGKKCGFGDAIDYLRHYRKMTFQQAKAMIEGQEVRSSPIPLETKGYTSDAWQEVTHKAMQAHIDRLWLEDDTTALDYARSRGLTDETIKQFKLGYSLRNNIPWLVIPSINEGQYVAIYRRDLSPNVSKDKRWKDAPGGTKNELYLADSFRLRKDLPVILVEDAFSAMSIWQEAGDIINPVATGSANCGQLVKWVARLARVPQVFIALDADKSGDEESKYWTDRLSNAQRLRPLLKDPNDMLVAGYDLFEWIIAGTAKSEAIPTTEEPPIEAWNEVCSVCGIDLNTVDTAMYDINFVAFCNYDPETREAFCSRSLSSETAVSQALALVTPIFGTIRETKVFRPREYTLEQRVAELEQEERNRYRMQQLTPRRRLAGVA